MSAAVRSEGDLRFPIDLSGGDFAAQKYTHFYPRLLESAPVCSGRISLLKLQLVSRYEDCRLVLSDERFIRDRGRAKGKPSAGPLPFPLPKSVAALAGSMIYADDPEHRRLRNLVNKAFTAQAVSGLEVAVEERSRGLLEGLSEERTVDLLPTYARSVPTRVIADMMGLELEDVGHFEQGMRVLSEGLSGVAILRTLLWDLRKTATFVRGVIARKRRSPGDDILTALIEAEDQGDRLSEDELLAMVFLLMIAGFETTQHLIGNGVRVLLEHPDQVDRMRSEPQLWGSAVEEIVRFRGPVHGTKPQYATEDVEISGHRIERGTPVMPLLGAANLDPRFFEAPELFDVARSPNHHLGFGFGAHFCLGKQLALMEARVSLRNLFERFPNMALAVPSDELEIVNVPGWHRHRSMPVLLNS